MVLPNHTPLVSTIVGLMLMFAFVSGATMTGQPIPQTKKNSLSAIRDLHIEAGDACGDSQIVLGKVLFLVSRNKSQSIKATVKVSTVPSEGSPTVSYEKHIVPPDGRIELGCSRAGSGSPIVVDFTYSVSKAVFLDKR